MKASENLVATITIHRAGVMDRTQLRKIAWWLIKQGLWLRKQRPESINTSRLTLRLSWEREKQ